MKRALLLSVALLAGCSGGQGASSTSASAQCGTLIAPPSMQSPTDGATGVADGNFTLVLSAREGTNVQLVAPDGTATTLTPVAGATTASYSVGSLQPSTTYTVQIVFAASDVCAAQSETAGRFTTK